MLLSVSLGAKHSASVVCCHEEKKNSLPKKEILMGEAKKARVNENIPGCWRLLIVFRKYFCALGSLVFWAHCQIKTSARAVAIIFRHPSGILLVNQII